jgi:hypothetical protein
VIAFRLPAPGCPCCGAGGSLPCFPCDPPAADLYLTILDGREPYRTDIPAESPVEIVLPYDPVTRSWGPSACTRLAGPHIVSANPTTGAPTYTSANTYAVFVLFCSSDFTPDGAVYRGRLLLGWTLWIDPPEGPLTDPCDHPENAIGSYVLNPDYLSLAECATSCDPLRVFWQASPPLNHFPWLLADSSGAAGSDIPGIDVTLCVTVLKCPGGPAVSGGNVTFHWPGTLGVTYTGTTDGSGVYCHAVARAGRWDIAVEVGGCEVPDSAVVAQCTGTVPVELYHCCGTARITVKDATNGDPIPGAEVRIQGSDTWSTCDGSGVAVLGPLPSQTMLGLDSADGDCTTRFLPIEARAEHFINFCLLAEVACGSTEASPSATDILLTELDPDGDGEDDLIYAGPIEGESGRDGWCTDDGCEEPGPAHRGYIGARLTLVPQVQIKGDDGTWYDVLGGAGDGAVLTYSLNGAINGTPSGSPWEAPAFGLTAPDIEYSWSGTSGAEPPVEVVSIPSVDGPVACGTAFGAAEGWLRLGTPGVRGLILRLHGTGSTSITIPTDALDCPQNVGTVDFVLLFTWSPCIDEWPWPGFDTGWVVMASAAGGKDYRYRVQATL